jgi:hypothetical protein
MVIFSNPFGIIGMIISMTIIGFNIFRNPIVTGFINMWLRILRYIFIGMSNIDIFRRPAILMSIIFRDPFI